MSAYMIFQVLVTDPAKLSEYAARAMPIVAAHGGKPVGLGAATVLQGSATSFDRGAVLEFPDRAAALAWYESPEYQALLDLRGQAMNCSVVLIGG